MDIVTFDDFTAIYIAFYKFYYKKGTRYFSNEGCELLMMHYLCINLTK